MVIIVAFRSAKVRLVTARGSCRAGVVLVRQEPRPPGKSMSAARLNKRRITRGERYNSKSVMT